MEARSTRPLRWACLLAVIVWPAIPASRAASVPPVMVLDDGGIQFPDGTVLESASYGGVTVVAKSGGDFTSIQAAIDSLPEPVGETHLIWVAPGLYEEQIHLKDHVHIRGAGAALTRIASTASPVVHVSQWPTYHNDNALSRLAVEGVTGGIEVGTGKVTLDQVAVHLSGPGGVGISVGGPWGGFTLTMTRSSVSVLGGDVASRGIFVYKAGLSLVHSDVTATGTGGDHFGIEVGDVAGARLESSSASSILGGSVEVYYGSSVAALDVTYGSAIVVYSEVGATVGDPSNFACLGAHRWVEPLDAQCQPIPPS